MRTFGTRLAPGASGLAMSLLLLTPASAVTQEASEGNPHPNWELGAAVTGNFLTGVSSELLDGGFGLLGFAGRRAAGPLWVRFDASYFGLEEQRGQSEVADNSLLSLVLGPEAGFGSSLLRGYLRAYGGLVVNFQSRAGSSLDTQSSTAGMLGGGVGIQLLLGSPRRPIAIDFGGDISRTGALQFARTSASDGVTEQDVVILTLHLGVSFGLPG